MSKESQTQKTTQGRRASALDLATQTYQNGGALSYLRGVFVDLLPTSTGRPPVIVNLIGKNTLSKDMLKREAFFYNSHYLAQILSKYTNASISDNAGTTASLSNIPYKAVRTSTVPSTTIAAVSMAICQLLDGVSLRALWDVETEKQGDSLLNQIAYNGKISAKNLAKLVLAILKSPAAGLLLANIPLNMITAAIGHTLSGTLGLSPMESRLHTDAFAQARRQSGVSTTSVTARRGSTASVESCKEVTNADSGTPTTERRESTTSVASTLASVGFLKEGRTHSNESAETSQNDANAEAEEGVRCTI